MYERVVVGTDLSSTAKVATDRAAALATRLGAELVLVYAGEDPGEPLEKLGAEYRAHTRARSGSPAEVLLSESESAPGTLLAVGSVGMSGAKRFRLGNVPNKVSHHASTDVLIVKTDPAPKHPRFYESILVGTDGSPTAMRAVDMASKLAMMLGIKPVIMCVYEPPSQQELAQMKADPSDAVAQWGAGREVRGTPEEFRWRIAGAAQAQDVLERAADHAAKQGVQADCRAVEGNAAERLIKTAEEEGIDLTVVGSVGMSGSKRLMLGNVPHRVSHGAPTDVLILHTT